jgi:hypothetical protein
LRARVDKTEARNNRISIDEVRAVLKVIDLGVVEATGQRLSATTYTSSDCPSPRKLLTAVLCGELSWNSSRGDKTP